MPILFAIVLAIILLPAFLLWAFFQLTTAGLENLGFSPAVAIGVLALMLLGSLVNIPLGRKKLVEVEEPYFFGLFRRSRMKAQGLSLNVGGGLIPILLASYLLLTRAPFTDTLLATALMVLVSYYMARVVPGKGIALPLFIPPLFAVLFAFLLAPGEAPATAFVSGVFGVLIGADVFHLPEVQRKAGGMLSIGGAGVFDGIFLIGLAAALLAGL